MLRYSKLCHQSLLLFFKIYFLSENLLTFPTIHPLARLIIPLVYGKEFFKKAALRLKPFAYKRKPGGQSRSLSLSNSNSFFTEFFIVSSGISQSAVTRGGPPSIATVQLPTDRRRTTRLRPRTTSFPCLHKLSSKANA